MFMPMLNFYRHSVITDPHEQGQQLPSQSVDLNSIKQFVDQRLLHFVDGPRFNYAIPLARFRELNSRTVKNLLSLTPPSDVPRQGVVGSCRDHAVLFCACLRHLGLQARVRFAFSLFFYKNHFHDQSLVEYRCTAQHPWQVADPRITKDLLRYHGHPHNYDLCAVPSERFLFAPQAWLAVRTGEYDPEYFRGGRCQGLWFIRDHLIRDFAAWHGMEMQLWDVWGGMFACNDLLNEPRQLDFYDQIATLLCSQTAPDSNSLHLFHHEPRLLIPHTIESHPPYLPVQSLKKKDFSNKTMS